MKKSIVITVCAAMGLSSCHTALYNAAERGDVETVRRELADGAPINQGSSKANLWWQIPAALVTVPVDVAQLGLSIGTLGLYPVLVWDKKVPSATEAVFQFGKKTPAEAAYERGHTAVLDELSKAGAGIAPESVAYKTIFFQTYWNRHLDYDSLNDVSMPAPATEEITNYLASHNNVASWIESKNEYTISTNLNSKLISWGDNNTVKCQESSEDYAGEHQLIYKRDGLNKAVVMHILDGSSFRRITEERTIYSLTFDSPASGSFISIRRDLSHENEGETWTSGRFRLVDAPAIPEINAEPVR